MSLRADLKGFEDQIISGAHCDANPLSRHLGFARRVIVVISLIRHRATVAGRTTMRALLALPA
jgi:hypothetical protein